MKIQIEPATPHRLLELAVDSWQRWECEPNEFDWRYEAAEMAYIEEGRVIVRADGESIELTAGMIVTFPAGLECRWQVIEAIRKVYRLL